MKVDFPNYDGWWRWSTQVYQGGLRLEAGKSYLLKFDASSSLAKNILVQIDKSSVGTHAVAPTYIEFTVVIPKAGTYKVTYTGKCSPSGIHYELRDSTGTPIAGIDGGPSDDWTMNHHNAILSAGTHTLRVFIAPGAGSITYLDNVIFELQ